MKNNVLRYLCCNIAAIYISACTTLFRHEIRQKIFSLVVSQCHKMCMQYYAGDFITMINELLM